MMKDFKAADVSLAEVLVFFSIPSLSFHNSKDCVACNIKKEEL